MKRCKYCQSEIDKKAKICPNCRKGQGIPKWIIIAIIAVVIIVPIIVGSTDNNSASNSTSPKSNEPKFSYTIIDEYDDAFSHYIEGTVTNNRDKNYSYLQIEFICYDKDGNNLGTALDNTNNLLGKQTWKFKAMSFFSDSKVDHCDFHEITGW